MLRSWKGIEEMDLLEASLTSAREPAWLEGSLDIALDPNFPSLREGD